MKRLVLGVGLLLILLPDTTSACATCYGASDAPMAQGMNWGIVSLLAVIGTVLGGVTSFFVFLGWRASKLSSDTKVSTHVDT